MAFHALLAVALGSPVLAPSLVTEAVAYDADDPAIWVCKSSERSLILGTDKKEKVGGLFVFDLSGKIVQVVKGLDRPNNVDVQYGFSLSSRTVDLAVVTERGQKRLRVFAIDRGSGRLTDVSGNTGVFVNRTDSSAVPMGISVSRKFVAIVSPKSGPTKGYLASYQLVERQGRVDTVPVQDFGLFSGAGEIESVFVDDDTSTVYYSDEGKGLGRTKGLFDGRPLTDLFATTDYQGDREGLAAHSKYLLSSDQIANNTRLHVYERKWPNGPVCVLQSAADQTDGLDATSNPLGKQFPQGILVMMNSAGKNFQIYDWRDVEKAIQLTSGR